MPFTVMVMLELLGMVEVEDLKVKEISLLDSEHNTLEVDEPRMAAVQVGEVRVKSLGNCSVILGLLERTCPVRKLKV